MRGPCADAGRVHQGSLGVPAHAHGVLARERPDAEIAGATKAVWASPRVTGADHDSQRACLLTTFLLWYMEKREVGYGSCHTFTR